RLRPAETRAGRSDPAPATGNAMAEAFRRAGLAGKTPGRQWCSGPSCPDALVAAPLLRFASNDCTGRKHFQSPAAITIGQLQQSDRAGGERGIRTVGPSRKGKVPERFERGRLEKRRGLYGGPRVRITLPAPER